MSRESGDRLARYIPTVQLFAARMVLFHQRIAEGVGLSASEYKCFRLVEQLGPMSATALAREAGLRLGTVSPLVEKLEAAGFITRERDGQDRRRLVLVADPEARRRAGVLAREQGRAMEAYFEGYSRRDFELVMNFLADVGDILARSLHGLVQEEGAEVEGRAL